MNWFEPPPGPRPPQTRAEARRRRQWQQEEEPAWRVPAPTREGGERYVLVVFQGPEEQPTQVGFDLFRRLRRLLRERIDTPPERTEVDVWLESPGGDANAAYKIALLLRDHAETVRVVIPDSAKSAATLMALCADEIYMAPTAELGPLDAQVDYDPEGVRLSALDIVRSLEFIEQKALRFTLESAYSFLETTHLSRADSLNAAIQLSAVLYQGLAQKIHPARMLDSKNLLDMTRQYADVLLAMPRSRPRYPGDASQEIDAEALVREFPTHSFVIDYHEAKEMGLPVRRLWDYPAWSDVLRLHEHVEVRGLTRLDLRRASPSHAGLDDPGEGGPDDPGEGGPDDPEDVGPDGQLRGASAEQEPEGSCARSAVGQESMVTYRVEGEELSGEVSDRARRPVSLVRAGRHQVRVVDLGERFTQYAAELTFPESVSVRRDRIEAWARAARSGR